MQGLMMWVGLGRDIKQLDYAKRHLQTTITSLKRLHMLVTAVDQLTFMAREHHYKEAANLVDAVKHVSPVRTPLTGQDDPRDSTRALPPARACLCHLPRADRRVVRVLSLQLATHFDSYVSITKIADIRKTIDEITTQLNQQITRAFNEIGDLAFNTHEPGKVQREDVSPGSFKSLAEACMVVNALGPEARKIHIDEFCRKQLDPYLQMFPKGGEVRLSFLERSDQTDFPGGLRGVTSGLCSSFVVLRAGECGAAVCVVQEDAQDGGRALQ
jgi:vacuolar protein sorting-associated protein 53